MTNKKPHLEIIRNIASSASSQARSNIYDLNRYGVNVSRGYVTTKSKKSTVNVEIPSDIDEDEWAEIAKY